MRGSANDYLPWLLESDLTVLSLLDGSNAKVLKCLAQVACDVTSSTGVTELSLVDHDMDALLNAAWRL